MAAPCPPSEPAGDGRRRPGTRPHSGRSLPRTQHGGRLTARGAANHTAGANQVPKLPAGGAGLSWQFASPCGRVVPAGCAAAEGYGRAGGRGAARPFREVTRVAGSTLPPPPRRAGRGRGCCGALRGLGAGSAVRERRLGPQKEPGPGCAASVPSSGSSSAETGLGSVEPLLYRGGVWGRTPAAQRPPWGLPELFLKQHTIAVVNYYGNNSLLKRGLFPALQ